MVFHVHIESLKQMFVRFQVDLENKFDDHLMPPNVRETDDYFFLKIFI